MGDAAAGGHPVHLAGANSLLGAEAVAVHEPAVEQIADGGEPDMRMRSDIGVAKLIGRQMQRTGMIEEDERPDHAALPKGQNELDGQRSEEHTSEPQSLMRITYAVFSLKKK